MHERRVNWLLRLLWRALAYSLLGSLACGIVAATAGEMPRGVWELYYHPEVQWTRGIAGALILGVPSFFCIGLGSQPDAFFATLRRALPLALLAMVGGSIGGAILLQATFWVWNSGYFPPLNPDWEYRLIASGPTIAMLAGQLLGAFTGAKRRWGAPEEFLAQGARRALLLGLMVGLCLLAVGYLPASRQTGFLRELAMLHVLAQYWCGGFIGATFPACVLAAPIWWAFRETERRLAWRFYCIGAVPGLLAGWTAHLPFVLEQFFDPAELPWPINLMPSLSNPFDKFAFLPVYLAGGMWTGSTLALVCLWVLVRVKRQPKTHSSPPPDPASGR